MNPMNPKDAHKDAHEVAETLGNPSNTILCSLNYTKFLFNIIFDITLQ